MDTFANRGMSEISQEIRETFIEAFIQGVHTTLMEMAQIETAIQGIHRTAEHRAASDVSAILVLKSDLGEVLVLSFPQATATALAQRILAEVTPQPDDEVIRDCMGELANVVAGQAKAMLVGTRYHFHFSTPQVVVVGAGQELPQTQGRDGLVIVFGSEVGEFALQLYLTL